MLRRCTGLLGAFQGAPLQEAFCVFPPAGGDQVGEAVDTAGTCAMILIRAPATILSDALCGKGRGRGADLHHAGSAQIAMPSPSRSNHLRKKRGQKTTTLQGPAPATEGSIRELESSTATASPAAAATNNSDNQRIKESKNLGWRDGAEKVRPLGSRT